VLAFLYADPVVIPMLDVYRCYYGWQMAIYIGLVFFTTMALSGLLMDLAFDVLGLIPATSHNIQAQVTHLSLDYTFRLNLLFEVLALYLVMQVRRHPMNHHTTINHDGHSM
jgi:hypothetical protein